MAMVGIRDVAREAGVAISTVSRVLNATGPVSAETRERVLRAAGRLGYQPNISARSLKISRSRTIGLLVRSISNPFFAPLLREIERRLSLSGYSYLMNPVEDGQDELNEAIAIAGDRKLSGVLLLGGTYDHTQAQIDRLNGVPCVMLTITAPAVSSALFGSVIVDDRKEARKATDHLLSLGHRDICYLAKAPDSPNTTGHRRLLGYREALEGRGIPYDPWLVMNCEYSAASGFDAMRAVLARGRRVTAVFAAADTIAIGAAKAALSAGLRIPEDLSVIGFDGIEAAEYYHPSLDTLVQPAADMAAAAVEILLEQIAQPGKTAHRIFEATIARRGSTRRIE